MDAQEEILIEASRSDFIVTVDEARREQPRDTTFRPNIAPVTTAGRRFQPLDIGPDRPPRVAELPVTPLLLFKKFIPESLVKKWIGYTHSTTPNLELTVQKVYLLLAAIIYMGIHSEIDLKSYFKSPEPSQMQPTHPIAAYMSYHTFMEQYRGLRIGPPTARETPFSRVSEWSRHTQKTSKRYLSPGTNLAVDECIISFTGKSKETVTIPSKPTPTGFKIWAIAEKGYFLNWLPHLRTKEPLYLQYRKRRRFSRAYNKNDLLNPTQYVVYLLANSLPKATYHVFLDNLFSSPKLFRLLRLRSIAATGTCRTNSGIYSDLVKLKAQDNKGKLKCIWSTLWRVPTPDGMVNQIAWKDNALVLMLTTKYRGNEYTWVRRKRPTTSHPRARQIQQFFGAAPVKDLHVPSITADYNSWMGGVDIGDQLRSQGGFNHRICKGNWRALAWKFLLEVIIINTFLLQRWGKTDWPVYKTVAEWRQQLCNELFKAYGLTSQSRKRCRTGDRFTSVSQHKRVRRKTGSPCLACKGLRYDEPHKKRKRQQPLGAVSDDSLNRQRKVPQPRSGCGTCNVSLCNSEKCWYFYHRLNC